MMSELISKIFNHQSRTVPYQKLYRCQVPQTQIQSQHRHSAGLFGTGDLLTDLAQLQTKEGGM